MKYDYDGFEKFHANAETKLCDFFQMTTFADRPGYQRISSSLWKQREDYCASLIQKAWKFHKLRNTESHTEEPHTGDEEDMTKL